MLRSLLNMIKKDTNAIKVEEFRVAKLDSRVKSIFAMNDINSQLFELIGYNLDLLNEGSIPDSYQTMVKRRLYRVRDLQVVGELTLEDVIAQPRVEADLFIKNYVLSDELNMELRLKQSSQDEVINIAEASKLLQAIET